MQVRLFGHDWHFGLGRVFGLLLVFAVLGGLGAFGFQVFTYYRGFVTGEINPLLNRRLESSVSKIALAASRNVSPADLERLQDPSAPSVGAAEPDLVIVEFLDYGCPFCRASFEPVRELVTANAGRVKLIVRDFPLEDIHPGAAKAAMAARCAQAQEKFWAYHDKLFLLDKRSFEDADLVQAARETGLDLAAFDACLTSERTRGIVETDQSVGLRAGVQGTPTFFFNGVRVQGALDEETLDYLFREFLKRADAESAS